MQRWTIDIGQRVTVDFLIPPVDATEKGGTVRHIEPDFAAIVTPALELAFQDRVWVPLADYIHTGAMVSREIPVCGPGAFTVLKALAFGNRAENKDAYDLFYVWTALGVEVVANSLESLQPDTHVDTALEIIERDFTGHDGPGPVAAARFYTGDLDDETQADVAGLANQLLRLMVR